MKKRNLTKANLQLNKNVISSLKSSGLHGGGTESCIQDADTACHTENCNTNNNCGTNQNCGTNGCATQGFDCQRTFSCDPGIC